MRKQSPIIAARQEARREALHAAIAARRERLGELMPNADAMTRARDDIGYLAINLTDSTLDRVVRLLAIAREEVGA